MSRFSNPWPDHPERERRVGGFLRWRWERLTADLPPDPDPSEIPREEPRPARPRASIGEVRITWIGHATFLVQLPGVNVLTDPVWSDTVSPVPGVGPRRFTPPGLPLDELPPVDAVVLSHGHYDHLDRPTVARLRERHGDALAWYTPRGYASWFERLGVTRVVELGWWEEAVHDGGEGPLRVMALPARHWSRRGLRANRRHWASWALFPGGPVPGPSPDAPPGPLSGRRVGPRPGPLSGPAPRGVYFGGDSGWCPAFREIGERVGPFRASLLPIGAYEPRWFMATSHIDPEEAVRAYRHLGARGAFVGMHWGTFRLTDEAPLEPPVRTRAAWDAAGLPADDLHLPGIGGTVVIPAPHPAGDPTPLPAEEPLGGMPVDGRAMATDDALAPRATGPEGDG